MIPVLRIEADAQESALSAQEKILADLRDELGYLKEQEATMSKVSCACWRHVLADVPGEQRYVVPAE
jgi:hypothetical protein